MEHRRPIDEDDQRGAYPGRAEAERERRQEADERLRREASDRIQNEKDLDRVRGILADHGEQDSVEYAEATRGIQVARGGRPFTRAHVAALRSDAIHESHQLDSAGSADSTESSDSSRRPPGHGPVDQQDDRHRARRRAR
ncbi:hypothetical protein AWW66_25715 [Micromonospora rosaria]|uniref:Uncharacterized protein n=1 Tax=Micromonospora rosaria TaxID=47874 RepID=A0A136PL20_9ACTN|nr:hypothetical protein [Micromonospora rosaria]KXK59160.1 hypothetical protein AWW66_25715 [Micromonospora rosaria]